MGKIPLVILAAGRGRRLQPFTDSTPKALIEFDGKTITEMIIGAFAEYIDKAVIVVGHLANKITERLGASRSGAPIIYVHNRAYEITGAATSLRMAKDHWAGKPCIIMEGDHLFHPMLAGNLIYFVGTGHTSCVLVDVKRPIWYGEETIALDGPTGMIHCLVWPARDLEKEERAGVLGTVLTIFRLSSSASTSLAANLWGSGEIIKPLNRVFRRRRLHYLSTMGLPWIEIDTPTDLERAQAVYEEIKKR